ncbi:MAG TPA: hypothetical protein VGC39_05450 [Candidatus Methylacidiphilales bacterium]
MTARPQVPFVLFKEDRERLLDLQQQVQASTGLEVSLGGILRLVIRVCPLDKALNLQALEILEDDKRREKGAGGKKRFSRMSCMVTPLEDEKLDLILQLISPVLRPKIKKSSLARLVLRNTPSSLIMLHTTREVFFDDLRRRDNPKPKLLRRKTG